MHRATTRAVWLSAVLMTAVCSVRPVGAVSVQAERELGRRFALAARVELPLLTDPDIVGYVDRAGQAVVRRLDGSFFDYHFFVVRNAGINAFAVPGGYIYVHSGLLTRLENDDELAAVLGHEIAHVHAHHLARQQEATQLMSYATLLGVLLSVVQPAIGPLATAAGAAVQLSYTRGFEQEADYMGARHMQAAGYDPRAMLDFLQKLADERRTTPTFVPPYLLSHPLTDERLNHLEAILRTQQWSARERPHASFPLRRVQALARARSEPPAEVVAAYRQALKAQPGDATLRYLFGLVCAETGQFDSAQTALEAARANGVTAADRELGRLALRSRQPDRARDLLKRAVEADPQDAQAFADLAQAYEKLGETDAALTAYRRAVELAPDMESAHHGLAVLAGRAGQEAEGFYHLAISSRLRGEYEPALSQFVRAEALLPGGDFRRATVAEQIDELSDFLRVKNPRTPQPKQAPTPPARR